MQSSTNNNDFLCYGAVGVDLLTVTPVDEAGNTCLIVVVVFYTKYVWATPTKEYTAHKVATALFTFFGYKVTYGKREMDADRKKAILKFQMPTCQREMQSFLGAALFFKSFVPNYSGIACELNKMTHKDFNWKRVTGIGKSLGTQATFCRTNGIKFLWTCTLEKIVQRDP